ncbi:MAG TPA: Ldh family oxidoreductase, partial [Thermodesulfobacteriota bacterium]|nr:Ldh family oxidoreductase [Thermodesulfobacteriota bacterium]
MRIVKAEDLQNLVMEIFEKRGVPKQESLITANSLVHAEIRGVSSHGIMRVAHYIRRLEIGSINPKPQENVEKTGPVTAFLDGDDGLGHVNGWHAMEVAVEMAREDGIGLVGIRKSSHCGALSFFAYQAMEAGLIGLAMTQTDIAVVPFGGVRPFLGTNPLCFGIPPSKGTPIVLDMATSTVAGGHIFKARAENRPIPEGWALDEGGRPTTDPHKAKYHTPAGGYKGYGLGIIVEVLTGLLMGGAFGPHVTSMYSEFERRRNLCHLVGAIDYRRFPGKDSFLERVTQMVDELHQIPTAEGFGQVLVPGEPEYFKEMERK